jgi:transposase
MEKRYVISLTPEERATLEAMTSGGRISALKVQRARILLKADAGLADVVIAEHVDVSQRTVERVRERCCVVGLEAALERKRQDQPSRASKLDGKAEARLVQLACCEAPEGRARWTLSLLAKTLVELQIVDTISITTVHRRLKKKRAKAVARQTILHPARKERGVRVRDGGRA